MFILRHLFSFSRSPIGYFLNVFLSAWQYTPKRLQNATDWIFVPLAEWYCIIDGIQDDTMF